MKVYEVVYETDGQTVKAPGISETECHRCSVYFAAETPEAVWNAITDLRLDPERHFVSLIEIMPAITVVGADNGRGES